MLLQIWDGLIQKLMLKKNSFKNISTNEKKISNRKK